MAYILPYVLAFAFGAVAGSFVNVCVCRIPRGKSVVLPRSSCPGCGNVLKARELIPLASYFMLRGRCSACGIKISFRYPAVEFICGALCSALCWKFGLSIQFTCYTLLCFILVAVFFIDLEWMRIPNALVICALAPALASYANYIFIMTGPERFRSVYNSVSAIEPLFGLIPCLIFLFIYIITAIAGKGKSAIGMGDIKLLFPAGIALGLRQNMLAVFIAVMLGGLAGIILIITRKKTRKDPIPFGPFIVIGIIAAIFTAGTVPM